MFRIENVFTYSRQLLYVLHIQQLPADGETSTGLFIGANQASKVHPIGSSLYI
jgi:hypothetical protein